MRAAAPGFIIILVVIAGCGASKVGELDVSQIQAEIARHVGK